MKKAAFLIALVLITGCKRDPIDRLTNPIPEGAVPISSGHYMIYDDELKTGGGLGFIPGGENQHIDLVYGGGVFNSRHSIQYEWNGFDVTNGTTTQHLFAGFSLSVSPDLLTINSTSPKNLSSFGYTKLKFFIRGTLASETKVRIDGPSDGNILTTPARIESGDAGFTSLTSDWQEITLTVPAGDFTSIKTFMTVSFQYAQPPRTTAPGNGGVVYLDGIQYVQ